MTMFLTLLRKVSIVVSVLALCTALATTFPGSAKAVEIGRSQASFQSRVTVSPPVVAIAAPAHLSQSLFATVEAPEVTADDAEAAEELAKEAAKAEAKKLKAEKKAQEKAAKEEAKKAKKAAKEEEKKLKAEKKAQEKAAKEEAKKAKAMEAEAAPAT